MVIVRYAHGKIVFSHVENPNFTQVIVLFEQNIVTGVEGSDVFVCASAIFPEPLLGPVQLTVDVSILHQGSAGIC